MPKIVSTKKVHASESKRYQEQPKYEISVKVKGDDKFVLNYEDLVGEPPKSDSDTTPVGVMKTVEDDSDDYNIFCSDVDYLIPILQEVRMLPDNITIEVTIERYEE